MADVRCEARWRALHSATHPTVPWISYSALRVIRQRITGSSVVLEYGAGHSTIYWGMHARQVYAVDDDRKWVDKVGREARERGLANVAVTLARRAKAIGNTWLDAACVLT